MVVSPPQLQCRFCGQPHAAVAVRRGTRLLCTRCGITLARRSVLGPQAPLAFALAALALAVPAVLLPFATVRKFGAALDTLVFDGALALWDHGLPLLAGWVALCGTLAPLGLVLALIVARTPANRPGSRRHHWAHVLESWSMPEVHILAVLVSFIRIEVLAEVQVGPGFWCYAAMAVALVLAERGSRLEPARWQ